MKMATVKDCGAKTINLLARCLKFEWWQIFVEVWNSYYDFTSTGPGPRGLGGRTSALENFLETLCEVVGHIKHAQDRAHWLACVNWVIPRGRVLLQNITVAQLVKKFPTIYGATRFINMSITARHWSTDNPEQDESSPHPTSFKFTLLSSHVCLGLPSNFFPSGSET
jgi:hypothetical protein